MANARPAPKRPKSRETLQARDKPPRDLTGHPRPAAEIPGVRLINLVRKALQERGLPERTIPDAMGITTTYWNSMTNGHRPIGSLPKEKMQPLADFLNLPLVQVYALADHFTAVDFAAKDDLEAQLLLCLEKMRADATWMALAPTPAEWTSLSLSVKIALAALYERVCAQEFVRKVQVELPGLHLPT